MLDGVKASNCCLCPPAVAVATIVDAATTAAAIVTLVIAAVTVDVAVAIIAIAVAIAITISSTATRLIVVFAHHCRCIDAAVATRNCRYRFFRCRLVDCCLCPPLSMCRCQRHHHH